MFHTHTHNYTYNLPTGVEEELSDSSLFSVSRQMGASRTRLSAMTEMLQQRSHDLELQEGQTATLLNTANELLGWVEQEMGQEVFAQRPPGELDKLKTNTACLQVF